MKRLFSLLLILLFLLTLGIVGCNAPITPTTTPQQVQQSGDDDSSFFGDDEDDDDDDDDDYDSHKKKKKKSYTKKSWLKKVSKGAKSSFKIKRRK